MWSNDITGSENPTTIVMDSSVTVGAEFIGLSSLLLYTLPMFALLLILLVAYLWWNRWGGKENE